jgi:hypothetical protein
MCRILPPLMAAIRDLNGAPPLPMLLIEAQRHGLTAGLAAALEQACRSLAKPYLDLLWSVKRQPDPAEQHAMAHHTGKV